MAEKGTAEVKVRFSGANNVKRAVNGIVRDTKRANDDMSRNAEAARKKDEAGDRKLARGKKKLLSEIERDHRRSEEAKRRESEKTRRSQERADKKAARDSSRARRHAAREAQAAGRRRAAGTREGLGAARSGMGMAMGAAGLAISGGSIASALGDRFNEMMRSLEQRAGVVDTPDATVQGMDMQDRLIRLVGQAYGGENEEQRATRRGEVSEALARASITHGVEQETLLGGLEAAQEKFGEIESTLVNIDRIAELHLATGASVAGVTRTLGEFGRQMNVAKEDYRDLAGVIVSAAKDGSVEFNDFAEQFSAQIGNFRRTTGRGGMEGAREFAAVVETIGAGGQDAEGTRMLLDNLLGKMQNADVQRNIQRRGRVDLFNADGTMRNMADVFEDIAHSPQFDTPAERQQIFGIDRQANMAVGILMDEVIKAEREGRANPIRALQESNAEGGNAIVDAIMSDLESSAGHQQRRGAMAEKAGLMGQSEEQARTAQHGMDVRQNIREMLPHIGGMVGDNPFFGAMINPLRWVAEQKSELRGRDDLVGDAFRLEGASSEAFGAQPLGNALQAIEKFVFGSTGKSANEARETTITDESAERIARAIGREVGNALRSKPVGTGGASTLPRGGDGGARGRE